MAMFNSFLYVYQRVHLGPYGFYGYESIHVNTLIPQGPKMVDLWIFNDPKYGNFSSVDPSLRVVTHPQNHRLKKKLKWSNDLETFVWISRTSTMR